MAMACRGVAPCLQSSQTHLVAINTICPISKHVHQPKTWSTRNLSPKDNLVGFSRRENSTTSVIRSSVVEFPAGPSSVSSKEEAIRKAFAYFATDSRPIVLFDGVCNFCNGGVNFVLDNDPEGRLRFAALQSEAGKALLLRSGRSPEDISSLVLVEKDRSYIKSEGVLRTAQYLGSILPPIGTLGLLFPLFFRDFLYDNVANNRYSILGQRDACRISDPRFEDRFVY